MPSHDELHARHRPGCRTARRARLLVALLALSGLGAGAAVVATMSDARAADTPLNSEVTNLPTP